MARVGHTPLPSSRNIFLRRLLSAAGCLKGKNPMSSPTDNSDHNVAAEAQPEVPNFEFHYSPAQFRLLEALQAAPFGTSIAELCRQANVSRAAYYRWQHNPGYRCLLYQVCAAHLGSIFPLLLMRPANTALLGDPLALSLIFPYFTSRSAQRRFNQDLADLNHFCFGRPEYKNTRAIEASTRRRSSSSAKRRPRKSRWRQNRTTP